jgi:lipopolysaccharide/colanic/teichoic acid biosynthesis glycosyltransferase
MVLSGRNAQQLGAGAVDLDVAEADLHTVVDDPAPRPARFVTVARLAVKRLFDIVLSAVALLVLSPILLAAMVAVKATSPGPALFSQSRIGRNGRSFTLFKLRTMVVDQGAVIDLREVEESQRRGVLVKLEADPRVTRVGAFLRTSSLDEVPQLFNVLRGDMSLVGPRPLLDFKLAPYPDLAVARSRMRPGLTGLWQVSAREDNTTALGMAEPDLLYIRTFRLGLDARILLRTIPRLLRGDGAV